MYCCEILAPSSKRISLLDTGSHITIAGKDFARKYNWKMHPHPTKTVKIVNGECMIIYGAARIPLRIGERRMDSEILVIGIDWLEKQGQFVWDFWTTE